MGTAAEDRLNNIKNGLDLLISAYERALSFDREMRDELVKINSKPYFDFSEYQNVDGSVALCEELTRHSDAWKRTIKDTSHKMVVDLGFVQGIWFRRGNYYVRITGNPSEGFCTEITETLDEA